MDKEKAKEFLFDDPNSHNIYISKSLECLLDMNDNELCFIYGVIETKNGEVLMSMDWSYTGEPILMRRFVHKKYLLKYKNKNVINL